MRVEVDWFTGPRADVRALFELADDSASQLDAYIELGRVLVARRGPELVGHLQLTPTTEPDAIEVKNMAVLPAVHGTGVGRALLETAISCCTDEGWSVLLVATGAADTGNLRFYQRLGFRMLSIERDAFVPATGYPEPVMIDGVQLRDRVWLSQDLRSPGQA
jgi:GNAT superfamily N-acetyltransferase